MAMSSEKGKTRQTTPELGTGLFEEFRYRPEGGGGGLGQPPQPPLQHRYRHLHLPSRHRNRIISLNPQLSGDLGAPTGAAMAVKTTKSQLGHMLLPSMDSKKPTSPSPSPTDSETRVETNSNQPGSSYRRRQRGDTNPNLGPCQAQPAVPYCLNRCPARAAIKTNKNQHQQGCLSHSRTDPSPFDRFRYDYVPPEGQQDAQHQHQTVFGNNYLVRAILVEGKRKKKKLISQAKQNAQFQSTSDASGSSMSLPMHCTIIGGSKMERKWKLPGSLPRHQQEGVDNRSNTAPLADAVKPNKEKSASQKKPKMRFIPMLTPAEKRSDVYRRLPPDCLVTPRRTPYNLLQESYAPDPWKVILICMLLNRTQGKPVSKVLEGFFACYPDAQAACDADFEGMVEYLRPLGLQIERSKKIKKFSYSYLNTDWTYVTELHGVGKYAADAYAIFCAGRAMEVQPDDHKLVDYWKYVCNYCGPDEDDDSCF